MNTTVSIIIPTYNRAHLICETLDSVIAQTYTNWECIIVDDGSTDTTVEIVAKYCKKDNRFKYCQRPQDRLKGGNAARNFGYEQSKGAYIQWFDSDDVMLENYLKDRVSEFTPEIDFVIGTGYSTDNNLKCRKKISIDQTNNLFKDYVLNRFDIVTQSVLFRRSFFKDRKLFKEELTRGQETELFSRLFYNTLQSQYIILNKPLYLYRQHDETKSKENKNNYNPFFKKSLSYISIANLERGLLIEDLDIINHHYQLLIHYFFNAVHNKDLKTAFYIYKNLPAILYKINISMFLLFSIAGGVFLILRRSFYRIEKQLKKYTL